MTETLLPFDLDAYLPYRFTVLAGQMSTELARRYREDFDISIPEWRVLVNVGYTQGLSIRDIEKRVSLERSKVSRAATRLEQRKLLTKQTDAKDKRLLKLRLTPKGVTLLSQLVPIAKAYQDELFARLGHDNALALTAALDRLAKPTNGPSANNDEAL